MVAKDVAEPLGYKNPREAIRLHCKHGKPVGEERNAPPSLDPQTIIIPESDVFRLIFRSRLLAAQRFEAWVMEEVLPAIRRTGSYSQGPVERVPREEIRPKPFEEWTLEEIRTHLSVANGYRHTLNNASAAWYLMQEGFPRPPERLMPAWWQADLNLRPHGAPADRLSSSACLPATDRTDPLGFYPDTH